MNIFLTVGSMLPFDRLVRAVDMMIDESDGYHVDAQIGEADYLPVNFNYSTKISLQKYRSFCNSCDLIISHVGMGTVISALEYRKPLIALPRRPELREVTSNHQVATAKWLSGKRGVFIIDSEDELKVAVSKVALFSGEIESVSTRSHNDLNQAIRQFIDDNIDNFDK